MPEVEAPPPPPTPEQPVEGPASLHTYSTDFSDKMEREGASNISVLAAQGNASQTSIAKVVPQKKPSMLLKLAAGLGVVLLAGAGIYGIYILVTGNEKTPLIVQAPSLVFADERRELQGPDYKAELAGLATEPLVSGNVLITYVTRVVDTEEGSVTEPQPGGALIQALDLGAPDILLRNTEPLSTVGVINAGSETRPFLVFRVTSFERTFAGMLTWEASIQEDLALFYPAYPAATVSLSTTTVATTTMPLPGVQMMFRDEVVENHDVRVLRDTRGRSIMLYGYRDKTTLIIARDEAAYLELANRLEANR
jgi:hypothetical protein